MRSIKITAVILLTLMLAQCNRGNMGTINEPTTQRSLILDNTQAQTIPPTAPSTATPLPPATAPTTTTILEPSPAPTSQLAPTNLTLKTAQWLPKDSNFVGSIKLADFNSSAVWAKLISQGQEATAPSSNISTNPVADIIIDTLSLLKDSTAPVLSENDILEIAAKSSTGPKNIVIAIPAASDASYTAIKTWIEASLNRTTDKINTNILGVSATEYDPTSASPVYYLKLGSQKMILLGTREPVEKFLQNQISSSPENILNEPIYNIYRTLSNSSTINMALGPALASPFAREVLVNPRIWTGDNTLITNALAALTINLTEPAGIESRIYITNQRRPDFTSSAAISSNTMNNIDMIKVVDIFKSCTGDLNCNCAPGALCNGILQCKLGDDNQARCVEVGALGQRCNTDLQCNSGLTCYDVPPHDYCSNNTP